MQQLKFGKIKPGKDTFGGAKMTYSPREARPLDSKKPLHLVLRAREGKLRLPLIFKKVNAEVERLAKRFGVRVYEYANAGNHLHLLIRVKNRRLWAPFSRALTGRLAQVAQSSCLGRPFTRIVKGWGKAYAKVKEYVYLNRIETEERLSRAEARWLIRLRKWFASSGSPVDT